MNAAKFTLSPQTRVRHPELLSMGDGSIIDDFCYISTRLSIGRHTHIASGCSIAGGATRHCSIGDYSSLSSGVKIWCTSNDFVNDLVMICPDGGDPGFSVISGDVTLANFTGVGSNTVIMPDNTIPEGAVIGALSFVPSRFKFEAWSVYAGSPLRLIKPRNKERVLRQVKVIDQHLGIGRPDAG